VKGAVSVVDESSKFGKRAARRLREEKIGWLTTVSPNGTPQPVPVWFLWDGDASVLVYSRPGTPKLRNIEGNPRVSLNLDGDGSGGDIVILRGEAVVSHDRPAHEVPAYVEKYTWGFERNNWSPEGFAADYSVPIRISLQRLHGH
jgi:PPOX class probable F420-dependent enzyme